ncbi:hypothetical protein AK812_SmicGene32004 [Symbiodinium microadriaticum]|uniref:Uncharacterized protein n=1 Tax=Symbiodinium microadriaticum TaxID=2951 RepID=A0A1Q9CVD6_SYMMI|nr:hypothetical protein AK812_SmicGene32004 [Symbiodinium microadriaticum]
MILDWMPLDLITETAASRAKSPIDCLGLIKAISSFARKKRCLPNNEMDVVVLRRMKLENKQMILVAVACVEVKMKGGLCTHFKDKQDVKNATAQVAHRVATLVAPVLREVCGFDGKLVAGAIDIRSSNSDRNLGAYGGIRVDVS